MRVVKHWPRLPSVVVDAPALETLKTRLDGALSNLVWLKMSLLTAGRLGWVASKGPSQPPKHSVILGLVFFVGMVLRFGFVTNTVLMTQGRLSFC